MIYDKLASRCINDIRSGLRGYHSSMSLPIEQLVDEIVAMRLLIIKEYQIKGIAPINDLLLSINCIKIDCKDLERCPICSHQMGTPTMHFEIPLVVTDYGASSISYIGSPDRLNPFAFYLSTLQWNYYHQYRRRGKAKPFVYIDITPNENGMYDCFVFNAPLMKTITIVAIFKDPRLLEEYGCCQELENDNYTWLDNEIQNRIVASKVKLYRQLAAPIIPNNQAPLAG